MFICLIWPSLMLSLAGATRKLHLLTLPLWILSSLQQPHLFLTCTSESHPSKQYNQCLHWHLVRPSSVPQAQERLITCMTLVILLSLSTPLVHFFFAYQQYMISDEREGQWKLISGRNKNHQTCEKNSRGK